MGETVEIACETDAPANNARPWSEEDFNELRRMKAAGLRAVVIAAHLKRTKNSIDEQWRWLNQTGETRQQRRKRVNLARKAYEPAALKHAAYVVTAAKPSTEMLAERDRRLAAERSVTAQLLGDPAPGYSALDRLLGGFGT